MPVSKLHKFVSGIFDTGQSYDLLKSFYDNENPDYQYMSRVNKMPDSKVWQFLSGIAFNTGQSYESLLKSIHDDQGNPYYLAYSIACKLAAHDRINDTLDLNRKKQWRPSRSRFGAFFKKRAAEEEEPLQLSPVMTITSVSGDMTVVRATFDSGKVRIEADAKIVYVVSLQSGIDIIKSAVIPLLKLEAFTIDNNVMIRDCLTKITTPDELVTGLLNHMKFLSGVVSVEGKAFLPGIGRHTEDCV